MQFEYDPEVLISEVKKRPGLWDFDHADYRTRNVRVKLWSEVVRELMNTDMNMTKGEMRELELQLQKKWKSLRDCFHKYVANPKRTKRPYIYAKQMQFLLKDQQKLPTKTMPSNIGKEDDTSESEEDDYRPQPSAWRPKKKVKLSNISDDNNDVFDNQDDYSNDDKADSKVENHFAFANVDAPIKGDGEDTDKMFLLSLLPHLKSIPEEFRLNAKMELMKVLQTANYSIAKLI